MYAEIREEMEANHWGKMVVIDVNSGDYEIGDDDLSTTMRLFERRPDAMTVGGTGWLLGPVLPFNNTRIELYLSP